MMLSTPLPSASEASSSLQPSPQPPALSPPKLPIVPIAKPPIARKRPTTYKKRVVGRPPEKRLILDTDITMPLLSPESNMRQLLAKPKPRQSYPKKTRYIPIPSNPGPVNVVETNKGDPFKLSIFVNWMSGFSRPPEHAVQREHTYSKPRNWVPEHEFNRPTRYLFYEQPKAKESPGGNFEVDIETIDPGPRLPFSPPPPKRQVVIVAEQHEDELNWEEKINRDGWTGPQTRLFAHVVASLDALELRAVCSADKPGAAVAMTTAYDHHANDLRYQLVSCHHDQRLPVWLHAVLAENLPAEYQIHYKEMLARVKRAVPRLVELMIRTPLPHNANARAATLSNISPNIELPALRSDPVSDQLLREKFKRLPHGPVFLVVPDDHRMHRRKRFVLLTSMLSQMGQTFTVELTQAPDGMAIPAALDHMTAQTRSRLHEVRSKLGGGRPLVLVGLGAGAALVALIAMIEPVTAIVCLGFPAATNKGSRGQHDDNILNLRCPVLFFTGEHSNTASVSQLDTLRGRMEVVSQQIVVGMTDDLLVMPRQRMLQLGITQAMVDKSILVEIHTFLGQLLTSPAPTVMPAPNVVRRVKPDVPDKPEMKIAARRYVKKPAKFPGTAGTRKYGPRTSIITSPTKVTLSGNDTFIIGGRRKLAIGTLNESPTKEGAAKEAPGLWKSRNKSPMPAPSPDRTKLIAPTPSPSVQRSLTFTTVTNITSVPQVPSSVVPTSFFATPSLPPRTTTTTRFSGDSNKLLTVLTSRPNRPLSFAPANPPRKPQPLTADNILNLPIIFAPDDEAPKEPITIPVMVSAPGTSRDQPEMKMVNKFEFSKPQPGIKYRKIFLTRLGPDKSGAAGQTPRLLGPTGQVTRNLGQRGRPPKLSGTFNEDTFEVIMDSDPKESP